MPTFEGVEITTTIDLDFEVFCGTCGIGLCFESNTRRSRNRGFAQVEVNVCPSCMDDKNKEISDLKDTILSLENKIIDLEN
jgi:hypothetical protein